MLTDLSLLECSGLDVARSVKSLQPETPVVLITGWGHLLDPLRLRDSRVDLMLVKPFRLECVVPVVADGVRLRRAGYSSLHFSFLFCRLHDTTCEHP